MKLSALASALIIAVSSPCLQAQEGLAPPASAPAPASADPDLPQPIDFSYAEDLVMQPPFTRVVSFEDSYQLTGVAYVDGRPVATVLNKQTKTSFVVSEEPNAQGWSLVAASAGPDLSQTQVNLRVGGEMISMHYGGQQLSPQGAGPDGKARLAGGGTGKKDGDKFRASSLLGQDGKKLYASLSPEGRGKFKDLVKARVEKHPEMTPEQNSAYAQKVFAKIKAADPGASRAPKTGKPAKKTKQGA